jgi:S-DNA-T family DNA segregation ATPase FtsK/SpoIIIE
MKSRGEAGSGVAVDLIGKAVGLVQDAGRVSTMMLQRRLGLKYSEAVRLMDALEKARIIGPHRSGEAREILEQKLRG